MNRAHFHPRDSDFALKAGSRDRSVADGSEKALQPWFRRSRQLCSPASSVCTVMPRMHACRLAYLADADKAALERMQKSKRPTCAGPSLPKRLHSQPPHLASAVACACSAGPRPGFNVMHGHVQSECCSFLAPAHLCREDARRCWTNRTYRSGRGGGTEPAVAQRGGQSQRRGADPGLPLGSRKKKSNWKLGPWHAAREG